MTISVFMIQLPLANTDRQVDYLYQSLTARITAQNIETTTTEACEMFEEEGWTFTAEAKTVISIQGEPQFSFVGPKLTLIPTAIEVLENLEISLLSLRGSGPYSLR